MDSSAAFPQCRERQATLDGPCDIATSFLMRPPPAPRTTAPRTRLHRNVTHHQPAFWMAFAWSTQFGHFMLEHLPRLWYYWQLRPHLQLPPMIVVPPRLAGWQAEAFRALSAASDGSSSAQLLQLSTPVWFSSLYVPGLLSYINLLWTPQALRVWDRVRAVSGRGMPAPAPPHAAQEESTFPPMIGRRLYSFRQRGGRGGAGAGRVLADQAALASGLQGLGFAPLRLESLSLAEKRHAFVGCHMLVLECGSALANAMLLPKGARVVLLCAREHTSSAGCFGQLLVLRYTMTAVHTLRVGETLEARAPTRTNLLNGVRAHAAWTLGNVSITLRAIGALLEIGVGRASQPVWPAPPPGCRGGHETSRHVVDPSTTALQAPTTGTDGTWILTPGSYRGAGGRLVGRRRDWWLDPEETIVGDPMMSVTPRGGPDLGRDLAALSAPKILQRSRIFSLVPACTSDDDAEVGRRPSPSSPSSAWATPQCWGLVGRRVRRAPHHEVTFGWLPCHVHVQCSTWRWCGEDRTTGTGGTGTDADRPPAGAPAGPRPAGHGRHPPAPAGTNAGTAPPSTRIRGCHMHPGAGKTGSNSMNEAKGRGVRGGAG